MAAATRPTAPETIQAVLLSAPVPPGWLATTVTIEPPATIAKAVRADRNMSIEGFTLLKHLL